LIYTDPKKLAEVRDKLKAQGLGITEAGLTFVPINTVKVDDPISAGKIIRLMDALDELDDVSAIYANFDIAEDLIDKQ
jgi:transcriptional/translational regulatory protein YebC/TACO1